MYVWALRPTLSTTSIDLAKSSPMYLPRGHKHAQVTGSGKYRDGLDVIQLVNRRGMHCSCGETISRLRAHSLFTFVAWQIGGSGPKD